MGSFTPAGTLVFTSGWVNVVAIFAPKSLCQPYQFRYAWRCGWLGLRFVLAHIGQLHALQRFLDFFAHLAQRLTDGALRTLHAIVVAGAGGHEQRTVDRLD